MTTDTPVSADDLAAALRDVLEFAWLYDPAEYGGPWQDEVDKRSVCNHAESLLDRYEAQRREEMVLQIRIEEYNRSCYMKNARIRYDRGFRAKAVRLSRAANHRILHLKRQLSALGGEA